MCARTHARRRAGLTAGWLGLAGLALCLCGCRGFLDRASPVEPRSPTADSTPLAEAPAPAAGIAQVAAPAAIVVTGRLVDALTGLPVRDAGVALLGLERRTISGPDGGFRFDGVTAGRLTIVLGPVEDYISRGVDVHAVAGASELGALPMRPAAPPTLIVPEYGGIVAGCGETDLTFASNALDVATPVRVTCLDSGRDLPAPAPAGRLPLAVVDLSPNVVEPDGIARLRVALPRQPRYGIGVPLDLLRLDLDRLIWVPTTSMAVDPGGNTATGEIAALGTYMVAAPPYGTFSATAGDEPTIAQFRIAAEPDGDPVDVHPEDTVVVYATFDYEGMANTPVTIRTETDYGSVEFDQTRPYTDRGRDNVPMVAEDGAWAVGAYVTTLYVGEPPLATHVIAWQVTDEPTPIPPTPSPPPDMTAGDLAQLAPPVTSPANRGGGCAPPLGWYAYRVLPGDTLAGLAARTGITTSALMAANCLDTATLYAGGLLYVPRPPMRQPQEAMPTWPAAGVPWPPVASTAPPPPTAGFPRPGAPATPTWAAPPAPSLPTTWYTPPAPPKPSAVPATLAPRPTAPPVPTYQPPPPTFEPPPVPTERSSSPIGPGAEPTAKWPTLPPEPEPTAAP